jgi:protein involved in polysaccharide export with SLBB domain
MENTSIWPYLLHIARMLSTIEENKQLHKDLIRNSAPNYAIKPIILACFYTSRKDHRWHITVDYYVDVEGNITVPFVD